MNRFQGSDALKLRAQCAQFICSSGRDKICTVWDLKSQKAKRTVPVYEVNKENCMNKIECLCAPREESCSFMSVCVFLQAVEGVVLLPTSEDFSEIGVKNKDLHFITAGSKGFSF